MPAATTPDRTGPLDALPPVEDLSYEEARDELVRVVARLEAGAATLEESLALWERGEALAERCRTWLEGARRRLERGAAQDAGQGGTEDGDGDDDTPGGDA